MSGNQGIKLDFVHILRHYLIRVRFRQVYLRERVQTKRYYAKKTKKHVLLILNTKKLKNLTQRTIRHFNTNACCSV